MEHQDQLKGRYVQINDNEWKPFPDALSKVVLHEVINKWVLGQQFLTAQKDLHLMRIYI